MPTVNGGHVQANADANNYAGVDTATATNANDWVLVLKSAPTLRNYVVGDGLTYNSKGTRNPNADNQLVVTSVVGPAKYRCTGNYPINT